MRYKQGNFKPKNPEKYKGDPTKIVYRSQWELKLMLYLDHKPSILWWKSEEIAIPYRSPVDNKIHRYFPDFIVGLINSEGKRETVMIEVKPKAQTKEPTKPQKVSRKYINEVFTYGVNKAKWLAAENYCADRGWKFRVMTEEHLGIK
jgi:hypothetical protein